jgi:hypothetical protein
MPGPVYKNVCTHVTLHGFDGVARAVCLRRRPRCAKLFSSAVNQRATMALFSASLDRRDSSEYWLGSPGEAHAPLCSALYRPASLPTLRCLPLNSDWSQEMGRRRTEHWEWHGDHYKVGATLLRVLTTFHRKPPLRRSRQGLRPPIDEVRADFAVLPGRFPVQCQPRQLWILRNLQRFRNESRMLSRRKKDSSAWSSRHHAVLP